MRRAQAAMHVHTVDASRLELEASRDPNVLVAANADIRPKRGNV
jgi:hypothetical protein